MKNFWVYIQGFITRSGDQGKFRVVLLDQGFGVENESCLMISATCAAAQRARRRVLLLRVLTWRGPVWAALRGRGRARLPAGQQRAQAAVGVLNRQSMGCRAERGCVTACQDWQGGLPRA